MSAPLESLNAERRRFALGLVGAAATAAISSPARAAEDGATANALAPCADPAAAFASAQQGGARPWTRALQSLADDAPPMAMQLSGRWPQGLAGSLYRNGPARHQIGGLRYAHWFDGDGLVQQYRIDPRGVTHRARFVRTDKFVADSAAGRAVRHSYGTRVPGAEPLRSPDQLNVANTNVLVHGGRLLALWEGGSAFELDPQTLATRGAVRWSDELAGTPFSAHPRIEPDGTMWNFGASFLSGVLIVHRFGADGRLAQHQVLRVPDLPMLHDFVVTERHLVFLLPPFVFDLERVQAGATLHEGFRWRPELGMRVMVLDKAQLDAKPRWFELPAGFVFHFGNGCEDGGVIRLDCMRSASGWQVRHGMRELMCGQHEPQEHTQATLIELDMTSGRARQTVLPLAGEFPRVDPRFIGRAYRQVFATALVGTARRPAYDAVVRMDVQSGRSERYVYGDDVLVEEHVFVPRSDGREGQGWLVGTALDLTRGQTLLSAFDAQNLAAGPLAQARMPRMMPLAWHGGFVPTRLAARA
jgi:all-trans-8'-apo-beta-carotenal 15,15'-oxygenase